jgi:hypothetical protein
VFVGSTPAQPPAGAAPAIPANRDAVATLDETYRQNALPSVFAKGKFAVAGGWTLDSINLTYTFMDGTGKAVAAVTTAAGTANPPAYTQGIGANYPNTAISFALVVTVNISKNGVTKAEPYLFGVFAIPPAPPVIGGGG